MPVGTDVHTSGYVMKPADKEAKIKDKENREDYNKLGELY